MKIAVVNEVSSCHQNADIVKALQKLGHEVINLGMTSSEENPTLTYLHTGLISALAIQLKIANFVVGGCGTGQGYLNSVLQYPGMVGGLLLDALDAWLFTRINDGNCISLALNKGYGWGGDLNLEILFRELFPNEKEEGYPARRIASQSESRQKLKMISYATHLGYEEIMTRVDPMLLEDILAHEPFARAVKEAPPSHLGALLLEKKDR